MNTPPGEPAYWTGSHLDSVPEGGNYDGLAGVVAGLMCLAKAKRRGVALQRPLAVLGLRGVVVSAQDGGGMQRGQRPRRPAR